MRFLIAVFILFVVGGFVFSGFTKADEIPLYRVLCAESFEVPHNITFRLYLHGTESTNVMIYTTSGKIRYNVNGFDPQVEGGFNLEPMTAIMLSYDQADAFRAFSILSEPARLFVIHLDRYPFP